MQSLNTLAKKGQINENANIRDSHSTIINASIETVWDILIDFNSWSSWNPQITKVVMEGIPEEEKDFQWNFGGTTFKSQVQAVNDKKLLSWSGKSLWIKGIYVWQLESDENQTIVTLSTSMQGSFITLVNSHQKVYNQLIDWLECLKSRAENG